MQVNKLRLRAIQRRARTLGGAGTLAVAVAVAAAACSGGGGSTSSVSSGSGSKVSGNLKILTWENPPSVNVFKKIDAEFEKAYPGVKVTLQTAANVNGPYKTLTQQAVNSSSADIITDNFAFQPLPPNPTQSNETPVQYWGTNGAFADLSGQSFVKSYTPAALASQTYQGKVYGIVSGSYQEGVFYDKDTFAKYHLSVPTTYDQFLTILKTLKSNGVQPLYMTTGGVGPIYLQFLYNEAIEDLWYPSAPGGDLASDLLHGTVKWTDPKFIQAMSEEKTVASYLEPNYTGIPWQSMPGDFAKGKGAMLLDGSWDLAQVQTANPSKHVGFFPLPFSNVAADNQPDVQNDLTFYVLSHAPNQPAAMAWLKFFSQPSIYAQWVNATGISSSQGSGTFNGYAGQVMGSWFGKGVNLSKAVPTFSPSNGPNDQTSTWPNLQLQVIQGKITPEEAAQEYQADWKTVS